MAEENGMSLDNPFIKLLSRMGDAMLLSILFVLSCIPIITIGDAFTALYYTAMKGITGDDGYIWKFYTRSFKQNFKQSTVMWLLFMVVFFVLGVDVWFWLHTWKTEAIGLAKPLLLISVVLLTLAFIIFIYAFALQAKFDNKISVQLRNAFLLSIKNFPTTILMMLIYAVIAWCFYYDAVISVIVFVIIGLGLVGYLWGYLMYRCFKPFLPEEKNVADTEFHFDDVEEKDEMGER